MSTEAEKFYEQAKFYFGEGEVHLGAEAMQQAIKLDPKNYEFRLFEIDYLIATNQMNIALEKLIQLRDKTKKTSMLREIYKRMIVAYEGTNASMDVIKSLNWIISNSRFTLLDLMQRAFHKERLSDFEGSLADLNLAYSLAGKNKGVLLKRAQSLNKLGRFEDAIKDLDEIIELNEDSKIFLDAVHELRRKSQLGIIA